MLDFIKRERLRRQGFACGKVRRKNAQGELWETLREDPSIGVVAFLVAYVAITTVLYALAANLPSQNTSVDAIYTAAIFLTAAVHWYLTLPAEIRPNSSILLTFCVIVLHLIGIGVVLSYGSHRNWDSLYTLSLAPHAFGPILLAMLVGRRISLFASVYSTLLASTLVGSHNILPFVASGLTIGFISVFVTQRVRRRSRLFTSGFSIGAVATLFMVVYGQASKAYYSDHPFFMLLAPLIGGVVTAMIAGAFMPALENIFKVTTHISWLELSDLNHPLMRRLSMEAPGTYHHSLMVANLSEAAAESIGANATMCRVASYFHDIGKLNKPEYFIENMNPDDNPHDDLTPRMSALVLIAHVKDGIDLAIKHGLNRRIIDVIEQHHGNSLVSYFYHRALEQKKEVLRLVELEQAREDDVPEVSEDGFRYPGPRPQSREAAIISLADAVESASRTLGKPTPARVEQLVDDLVRNRLLDDQLDECDLTLAELAIIKASFVKTLLSMMHSRIQYPKVQNEKAHQNESRHKPAAKEALHETPVALKAAQQKPLP